MDLFNENNSKISELIYFLKNYFAVLLICSIGVYFVLMYSLNILKQKVLLTNSIVEELCKAVLQNELINCITILDEHSEYVNRYTKSGYTPFLLACATGNTQIVKIMLRKGLTSSLFLQI